MKAEPGDPAILRLLPVSVVALGTVFLADDTLKLSWCVLLEHILIQFHPFLHCVLQAGHMKS